MNDVEQLLLINKFCDRYEAELQSGSATGDISQMIEMASRTSNDQDFLDSLLAELLALRIVYSDDRDSEARSLKSMYPDHVDDIESALVQPSLLGTVLTAGDVTDVSVKTSRSKSPKKIAAAGRRFENLELYASGGLGDVYIGYDRTVQRKVAVKLLKPELVSNDEAKTRFLREGAITGSLEHPAIVPIYDSGSTDAGQPYYAMRLIEGKTLREAISELHADRNAPEFEANQRALIRRLTDVCDAIAYAHHHGVIHRDLKPANILLGDYGETVVIDWGLARRDLDEGTESNGDATDLIDGSPMQTRLGRVLGTPEYMSPEQATGDPSKVGRWSDVYCLGAVLYAILTGSSPGGSEGDDTAQRIEEAAVSKHPSARERFSGVHPAIDAICSRALSRTPSNRYRSANYLAKDLDLWLSDLPVAAKPDSFLDKSARFLRKHRRWSAAAGVALVAITVGSLFLASVINDQRRELAVREAKAEEQARVQTALAEDLKKSQRFNKAATTENRQYVSFMRDFFNQLEPDQGGREIRLVDVLDQIAASLKDNETLSNEARRDVMDNIANGYFAVRKDKEALELIQEYVRLTADSHSPTSINYIDAHAALATALSRNGRPLESLEIYDECLASLRGTSWPEESQARVEELERDMMRHRLTCLDSLDRRDELKAGWEEMFPWLLDLDLDNLPTDPDSLHYASQYIEVLRSLGDGERALEWQKKLFEMQKQMNGERNTATLGSLYRLTKTISGEQGHLEALPYSMELVELASEVLGAEHPNTLVARTNLADTLFFVGDYREAHDRLVSLEAIWRAKDAGLANLLSTHSKLARTKLLLGEPEAALDLLNAFEDQARQSEDISASGAMYMNRLYTFSLVQMENGRYDDAIKTIEREITILTSSGREKEASEIDLRNRLQLAYLLNGDLQLALDQREYYTEGEYGDVEFAQTAMALFRLGKTNKAKRLIDKLLERPVPKFNHPMVVERSKCLRAEAKGLLALIIAEVEPERSAKLLEESVTELHNGFQVVLPNSRVRLPLKQLGTRLVQSLKERGETELAETWQRRLEGSDEQRRSSE